jgi:NADH dehydrogenase (ubiquinone) 1 beta subcomplex subunit 10
LELICDAWLPYTKAELPCREKFVELEATKEVRRKLKKCYLKEGVNHLQNCRDLRLRYLEAIKTVGWGNR